MRKLGYAGAEPAQMSEPGLLPWQICGPVGDCDIVISPFMELFAASIPLDGDIAGPGFSSGCVVADGYLI